MTSQDPINQRARELFDRASDELDQGAAFRLRRARHEAQQPRRKAMPGFPLVPAGAVAAAVLALGVAWWMPGQSPAPSPTPTESVADAEIEALLVEEDPELYAWLAEAPVAVAGTGEKL